MLCLTIRLRLGTYDAGAVNDPSSPEWPPHPARLFCALVAGDPTEAEWAALRWLESQPSPEVHAPNAADSQAAEQFLVTNVTQADGGSQLHPGRKQIARVKPRLFPTSPRFHMMWPAAQPTDDQRAALTSLANRVPYLGRATSDAEVTVADATDADIDTGDALVVYEPVDLRDAEVDLRVPYVGYCDRLVTAFADGDHAWEQSRPAGYRRRRQPTNDDTEPPVASPFGSLMVLAIDGRSHVAASHTAKVTEILRRATISLVERELGTVPTAVAGHGDDEHVAYLGLPNVGAPDRLPGTHQRFIRRNPHADGRLLGVALAIPRDSIRPRDLRRSLMSPTSGARLDRLTMGGDWIVPLKDAADVRNVFALSPLRWCRPSRWWATATPVVLDRFPKPGRDDVAALVADALVTAGYPRPAEVRVDKAPFLPGAPMVGTGAVQRRAGAPVRPWRHAWARFDRPVGGPVIAGSMRYRGLGLFAPLDEDDEGRS